MSHVLFLTRRMSLGFGVDVVVQNLGLELRRRGHDVTVGCVERDATFGGLRVVQILPHAEPVRELARAAGADLVVAHTSPFFELLPELAAHHPCWAWEHGDPTPELFGEEDAARRREQKRYKCEAVYGRLRGVVAISEFVRSDLPFPPAQVVLNGCDHAPDLGSKGLQDRSPAAGGPLRVGTLMRLGPGEARYKGGELFCELAARLAERGLPVELHVMGRGRPEDAADFLARGIRVHLNASDREKWEYLRGLDIFVSCSLWEGFNLPLAEAQALGTLGLAFDTGAHPEVTPYCVGGLEEASNLVAACAADGDLLLEHSRAAYHFVRQRFSWGAAAQRFIEIAELAGPRRRSRPSWGLARARLWGPLRVALAQTAASLREEGPRRTAARIAARLRRSFPGTG